MDKEQLQKIIDQLDPEKLKEEAYFGIFEFGGSQDESFIKANKQGLEIFAAELLKASRDTEEPALNEKQIFPLGYDENWVDQESKTFLHYVMPVIEKRASVKHEPYVDTWKDKAIQAGCISAVVIAITSAIVGVLTIIKWIW